MLIDSKLLHFLWGEALQHANWIKRQSLTRAQDGKTPYQLAMGLKPDLSLIPLWGCCVWVTVLGNSKLSPRTVVGNWVGFLSESKGHHIY